MNIKQPQFPSYFADAECSYSKAKYVLFGVPYDKTSSFRFGSIEGPKAIRHASWNLESFNLFNEIDFRDLPVHDFGDINNISNFAPSDMIVKVESVAKKILHDEKIPIAFGGEHSTSIGIIKSIPTDTFVLICDAHLDYRQCYEDEPYNHACTIRRITDFIPVDQIILFGIRSAEKEEYYQALKDNLTIYTSKSIFNKGINHILQDIKKLIGQNRLYVSIDIDVLDPGFAPGTGTPEPFGLNPYDLCTLFDFLNNNLMGFDIMEVNPLYDQGQTAMLAARYIRYGIEKMSQIKH
jgi:agmatinase